VLRYGKVKSECTTSITCRTGRPAAGTVKRAVAGGGGGTPAGETVVVQHHPAAFELAPTDALHLHRDRGSDRHVVGEELHRHVDAEGVLSEKAFALLENDIVHEAEIVGRGERRRDAAGGVALHGSDAVGGGRVLAAEMPGVPNLPAARHRAPDKIEFLRCRETFAGHCHRSSYRTMDGPDLDLPDIAARRLSERRRRTEFGNTRRGGTVSNVAPGNDIYFRAVRRDANGQKNAEAKKLDSTFALGEVITLLVWVTSCGRHK
jgi:hypothetical protein